MKRLPIAAIAGLLLSSVAGTIAAQDLIEPQAASRRAAPPTPNFSPGEVTPSEAMWFYQEQMRLYNDPHFMQRKRAEFRAQQRAHRMAAMSWFGYSNARPSAGITPFTGGSYSPAWVGNVHDPYAWRGVGYTPLVVVRPVAVAPTAQGLW